MTLRVLVFGFVGKSNIGDDLFETAFQVLFPQYQFTFTDYITVEQAANADVLFVGGGSLLDGAIESEAGSQYRPLPVLYLGVGTETAVHPDHQHMLGKALLVATRTKGTTFTHPKLIHCPDLVYALKANVGPPPTKKLLFLPNAHVVPSHNDPHWKHKAWEFFKSEVSQFLDLAVNDLGYQVTLYAMCRNESTNDLHAAAEIHNMVVAKPAVSVSTYQARSFGQAIHFFGQFSHVVTQRYHGIVLSNLANRPVVSVWHHDKLKANSSLVPYYGATKHDLLVQLDAARANPVDSDFTKFKAAVERACATLV